VHFPHESETDNANSQVLHGCFSSAPVCENVLLSSRRVQSAKQDLPLAANWSQVSQSCRMDTASGLWCLPLQVTAEILAHGPSSG